MATMKGGEGVTRVLAEIADKLTRPATLRVGFLSESTYPGGTSVAMVAALNEFGVPSHGQPPRPFFRNLIADKSPEWPEAVAELLRANDYDLERSLDQAGFVIAGQLRESIQKLTEPPLAPSTIAKKGSSKPLIDSGVMIAAVDHEVTRG